MTYNFVIHVSQISMYIFPNLQSPTNLQITYNHKSEIGKYNKNSYTHGHNMHKRYDLVVPFMRLWERILQS